MVVRMKKILLGLSLTSLLVACSEPQPEGDQYFDQITPIPGSVQAENAQPIPPTAEIQAQPIGTPATNVDSDGVEYETVAVDGIATEPATLSTSTPPAPAPGLYEPALSVPEEDTKAKKKAAKPPKEVKLQPRSKTLDLQEYAATQTHLVGEKKYNRSKSKYEAGGNCDQYTVPEIAQIAFLNAGGPRKDTLLLDADGDGFACAWVPQR